MGKFFIGIFLGMIAVDEARIHVEDSKRLGASCGHSEEQHRPVREVQVII